MPGNKPIPVKPLTSFIKGGIREHMFDLAHDVLDSLESRIIRLRDLEAFVIDIPEDPEIWDQHLIYRFDDVARYMERFQDVEQLVDEPLFVELRFGGEGLMDACKFDSLVGNLERDVEAAISRLEEYIAHVLGELPDEISSGKLRTENIELYRELVNLYGSSELPSLATSFESKSKDEVIKQAHGVLKTLQHLLDRASSLALECISSGENCFNSWETGGLGPLLDYAEHMFNLKQYIAYRGQVITKFMAGKFDRSATRLDCLLRAYILCYEDLPKEGTPWELDMPSLRATYYDMSMLAMCTQNKEDHTALKSLLDVCREVSLVLEAYVRDIIDNPETEYSGPDPDFRPPFAQIMTEFMEVQLLVEKCLFTGKAFMKLDMFDKRVGMIANDVEIGISLLEEFIEFALGKLPMEINPRLSTSEGIYSNIASFYGFSELPSLEASFDSKSGDEVLQEAKGVIETLELLLEQAKSVTLGRISRNEDSFFAREAEELGELVDLAELLALLRRYVHNTQRDGLAITKFMIGKFDRSTARLDCCIRVFTIDYNKLPKRSTSTPTELDIASLPASCKGRNLDGIYVQHDRDDKTLDSLFNDLDQAYRQAGSHDAVAAMNLKDRAGTGAIRNRQTVAKTLRQTNDGGLFWDRGRSKALGVDFIKNALAILHGQLRADMKTLEKLISDLKALCPDNQAPARGGLADRFTT
ncbi:hypothetical protein CDV31_011949 [Fusarium ambrosium]|uniref:Uncharacterized protein n=1 Tax=Fusarium ambrosium TaxID=131363 RepID=A0A428TD77_9HYPO|nr:hypothetical protein CDV31_011949 [Fusarium ambrosium]